MFSIIPAREGVSPPRTQWPGPPALSLCLHNMDDHPAADPAISSPPKSDKQNHRPNKSKPGQLFAAHSRAWQNRKPVDITSLLYSGERIRPYFSDEEDDGESHGLHLNLARVAFGDFWISQIVRVRRGARRPGKRLRTRKEKAPTMPPPVREDQEGQREIVERRGGDRRRERRRERRGFQ